MGKYDVINVPFPHCHHKGDLVDCYFPKERRSAQKKNRKKIPKMSHTPLVSFESEMIISLLPPPKKK